VVTPKAGPGQPVVAVDHRELAFSDPVRTKNTPRARAMREFDVAVPVSHNKRDFRSSLNSRAACSSIPVLGFRQLHRPWDVRAKYTPVECAPALDSALIRS